MKPRVPGECALHLKSGQSFEFFPSVEPLRVSLSFSLAELKALVSRHLGDTPSASDIVLAREIHGGLAELQDVSSLRGGSEETLFVFSSKSWNAYCVIQDTSSNVEERRKAVVETFSSREEDAHFLRKLREAQHASLRDNAATQEARKRLAERAAQFGLQENPDIDQQGDCQFDAAADQLRKYERFAGETKESVRVRAVKWIRDNGGRDLGHRTTVRQWVEALPKEEYASFDDYLEKMSRAKCWGDEVTLMAICELYQVGIVMLSSVEGGNWHRVIYPGGKNEKHELALLWLGHEHERHYWSLVEGSESGAPFKKLKQVEEKADSIFELIPKEAAPKRARSDPSIPGFDHNLYASPEQWLPSQYPICDPDDHTLLKQLPAYVSHKLAVDIEPFLQEAVREGFDVIVVGVPEEHFDGFCVFRRWKVKGRSVGRTRQRRKLKVQLYDGSFVPKLYNVVRPSCYKVKSGRSKLVVVVVTPGRDYVKHFAQMIRYRMREIQHAFDKPERLPLVEFFPKVCEQFAEITQLASVLDGRCKDATVFLGCVQYAESFFRVQDGFQGFVGPSTLYEMQEALYGCNVMRFRERQLVFLGVVTTFWGDLAGVLAQKLYLLGASNIVYIAKLGALTSPLDLLRDVFIPKRFFLMQEGGGTGFELGVLNCLHVDSWIAYLPHKKHEGDHLSVPTIMDETRAAANIWRVGHNFNSLDNEISNIAKAAKTHEKTLGVAHYATDYLNVWLKEAATAENMLTSLPGQATIVLTNICGLVLRFLLEPSTLRQTSLLSYSPMVIYGAEWIEDEVVRHWMTQRATIATASCTEVATMQREANAWLKQVSFRLPLKSLASPMVTSAKEVLQDTLRRLTARALECSVEKLRDHYKSLRLFMLNNNQGPMATQLLSEAWIQLHIVNHDGWTQDHDMQQQPRELYRTNENLQPIALEAIFDDSVTRVVALGRAGVGKSTLVRYVCQQWALEKLWKGRFDVVVLVPLPEISMCNSVESVLAHVFRKAGVIQVDVGPIWQHLCGSPRALWVLDGVDEVSVMAGNASQLLNNVEQLPCTLITTRPEASQHIARGLSDTQYRCVEVEGFTPAGVVQYVLQFFDLHTPLPCEGVSLKFLTQGELTSLRTSSRSVRDERQERIGVHMMRLLDSSPVVREIACTPLNAELLCYAGKALTSSANVRLHDVYSTVVVKMIKHGRKFDFKLLEDSHVLQLLARVAWDSLGRDCGFVDRDSLVVAVSTLGIPLEKQRECVDFVLACGPWKMIGESHYYWTHYTFQEYLAALHVAKYTNMAQIADAFRNARSHVFYEFVCGISCSTIPKNEHVAAVLGHLKTILNSKCNWRAHHEDFLLVAHCIDVDSSDSLLGGVLEGGGKCARDGLAVCAGLIGNERIMRVLLERGTDPNHGIGGSAYRGHESLVRLLLDRNADPSVGIGGAAAGGQETIVRLLLNRGADPDVAISGAAWSGHEAIVRLLLDRGADPNQGLLHAALNKHAGLVRLLLERGTDPSKGTISATHERHEALARLLLERGTDLQFQSPQHMRAYGGPVNAERQVGAQKGSHGATRGQALTRLLVERGAELGGGISLAARGGHTALVQLLLERGADPDMGISGAARGGHAALVQLLLERGADPDMGISGAARGGHAALVQLLLKRGAHPSAGIDGAAFRGDAAIVMLLLEEGADSSKGIDGAAWGGHEAIVRLLLEQGAPPSEGIDGAAWGGHEAIVRLLLERGAPPSEGMESAALGGHEAIVRLLLERGAPPSEGMESAALGGHEAIVRLLLERGADPKIGVSGTSGVIREPKH